MPIKILNLIETIYFIFINLLQNAVVKRKETGRVTYGRALEWCYDFDSLKTHLKYPRSRGSKLYFENMELVSTW